MYSDTVLFSLAHPKKVIRLRTSRKVWHCRSFLLDFVILDKYASQGLAMSVTPYLPSIRAELNKADWQCRVEDKLVQHGVVSVSVSQGSSFHGIIRRWLRLKQNCYAVDEKRKAKQDNSVEIGASTSRKRFT